MSVRRCRKTTRLPCHRAGITLAEVVISTLLVGLVMVGAMASVGGATKSWITSSQQADGQALARALLSEIVALPYEDPSQTPSFGTETGETGSPGVRSGYDDVDDYLDLADSPPHDRAGVALSGYSSWQRTADVVKVNPSGHVDMTDGAADLSLRRITVTVTSPSGKVTTLEAYRTRSAGTQQPLGIDQTVVTYVGVKISVGTNSPLSSGTPIVNHAEDRP